MFVKATALLGDVTHGSVYGYFKRLVLLCDSRDSLSRDDLLFPSLLHSQDHWRAGAEPTQWDNHPHRHSYNSLDFYRDFFKKKCCLSHLSSWDSGSLFSLVSLAPTVVADFCSDWRGDFHTAAASLSPVACTEDSRIEGTLLSYQLFFTVRIRN